MLKYTPNAEQECERVNVAVKRFRATGDVLWTGSRAVYRWLSANLPTTVSVLDVGCGAGFGTYLLSPRQVVGVDKNATSIAFAKSVYPRMQWAVWDIALSPYPQQFDVVAMCEVIEHIDDWISAIENAKACAKSAIILTTPNRASGCVPDDHPSIAMHVREFTMPELCRAFVDGWSVQSYAYARFGENNVNSACTFMEVADVGPSTPMMLIARRVP